MALNYITYSLWSVSSVGSFPELATSYKLISSLLKKCLIKVVPLRSAREMFDPGLVEVKMFSELVVFLLYE